MMTSKGLSNFVPTSKTFFILTGIIIVFAVVFGGCIYGGYQWGFRIGHSEGSEIGADNALASSLITDCVYLTLAARSDDRGESTEADDLRFRLLYGATTRLDSVIESGRLESDLSKDASRALEGVVDYYWQNQETTAFFARHQFLREFEPKLMALFEKKKKPNKSEQATPRKPSD